MKKIVASFGALLWIVLGICETTHSQDQKPVKLVVCEPLSGPFRNIGERFLDGAKYAVREINTQGGLLGHKVEIVPIDNQLKPDIAIQKINELSDKEQVRYVIVGTGSHIALALSPLAKEKKFILFSYAKADSLTGEKCNRYFFRTVANTSMHSGALAFWVVSHGYKKVFGIAQDYAFGRSAMAAFKKKLQVLDPSVKMVGEIFHPLGEKNFGSHVSKIISSGPEIVFTPNWGSDLALLLKQAGSSHLQAKFAGYYMNDSLLIRDMANDEAVIGNFAAENYMVSIPTEKNKEFVKKFYKDKGYYPDLPRGTSYMGTMFWAQAIKKAGKNDVEAVIDTWEGLIYDGPAGKYYMRPCDHQAQMPMWTAKIVKDNPFFDHAYVGEATTIPTKFIVIPCMKSGCPGLKNER